MTRLKEHGTQQKLPRQKEIVIEKLYAQTKEENVNTKIEAIAFGNFFFPKSERIGLNKWNKTTVFVPLFLP